jgi:hypothetical protein
MLLSLAGCRVSHDMVLQPDPSGSSAALTSQTASAGMLAAAPMGGSGHGGVPYDMDASMPVAPPATAGKAGVAMAGSVAPAAGSGEPSAGEPSSGEPRAGEPSAGAPATPDAGPVVMAASDPACDMTGVWIGKQIAVGVVLELPQSVNIWHYFEISQQADDFVVTKHIDCGVEVLGDVTVTITRATLEGTVQHNHQDGRKGTLERNGARCDLDIARFWSIRGAEEARFIPNPTRDSTEQLTAVAAAKPLPTAANPDGALDPENDGKPGIAAQITGIASGTRNSVQREWHRWFTEPGYEIAANTDWQTDLRIRAEYDMEESVIDPTSGLLTTVPAATNSVKHVMLLRFLGRDLSDPRAAAVVKGNPVDTCYALQDALPAERLM